MRAYILKGVGHSDSESSDLNSDSNHWAKSTGEKKEKEAKAPNDPKLEQQHKIYGFQGQHKSFLCSLGAYLIVITKREKVGELMGHTIWRVADTEVHSYKRTTTHLTEQQVTLGELFIIIIIIMNILGA